MSETQSPDKSRPQIRAFSIVIGALLVPILILWVAALEEVHGIRTTYLSIFFHAVLLLVVLTGFNALLRLITPRYAFNRAELLIVYIMIAVSSGIVGDQFMAVLVPSLAHPFRYANEANLWQTKLIPYLPEWAMVSDPHAVRSFYEGFSTLYQPANFMAWLRPGLIWAGFIAVTQLMCLGTNIILRRQWTDYEKLSFPLIRIPMAITETGAGSIWRNKLMWWGFGAAAFIGIVNGLHIHWPMIPDIPVKFHWISFPADWGGALNSTAIAFYPFVIGIAYFLPTDLTFSTWFFFIILRLERLICSALGLPLRFPWSSTGHSTLPAMIEQGIGGYIALVAFALWTTRHHLQSVWQAIWSDRHTQGPTGQAPIGRAEATEYRIALGAIVAGLVLTTWFASNLGMPVVTGLVYFVLFLVINTAITKIRAEAGVPTHGFHFAGPDHILLTMIGPNQMSPRQMSAWALLFGFNRAYTGVPMPHQLEGMKMGELVGAQRQRLTAAQALATVVGCLAAVWALLHFCYRDGVEQMQQPVSELSGQGWTMMNSWLVNPIGPNWLGLGAIAFGFLFAAGLMWMRYHFIWWPFHPIGYAIAPDWTVGLIWMPLMIGWTAKSLVMRYGGPNIYHQGVPLALGLILGEFTVGGFWALLATITHQAQYTFWP